jgi:predicted amino acid-binding ACT domain protein
MSNQSVRVQMSDETIAALNKLSIEHNCTYNNQPSISRLLSQIGNGTLTIQTTGIQKKSSKSKLPLLSLKIIAPFNLSGIIAVVSATISKHKGNIYSITAEALDNSFGVLKILLSLEKGENNPNEISSEEIESIIGLLKDLKQIKYSKIKGFNLESQLLEAHKLLLSLNKAMDSGGGNTDIIKHLEDLNLVLDCRCTVAVRILANNRVRTIADITQLVAEKQVFISKIEQKYNAERDKDIFYLFLEIRLNRDTQTEQKEVSDIFNEIKTINDVEKIERLGIDSWI